MATSAIRSAGSAVAARARIPLRAGRAREPDELMDKYFETFCLRIAGMNILGNMTARCVAASPLQCPIHACP